MNKLKEWLLSLIILNGVIAEDVQAKSILKYDVDSLLEKLKEKFKLINILFLEVRSSWLALHIQITKSFFL